MTNASGASHYIHSFQYLLLSSELLYKMDAINITVLFRLQYKYSRENIMIQIVCNKFDSSFHCELQNIH